ncbi:CYFA0S17e00754g1_1 [Cyberlindnera fabianii]|uniref:CYFA0S17e00754g1_1 n=1 Tax=Cyberlindnera fabianii TaxID=36022 RepID=A0A061B5N0_CYBFA|nr:CYFA0S17e00754g1_1 [Cyberlindnera fabianii]
MSTPEPLQLHILPHYVDHTQDLLARSSSASLPGRIQTTPSSVPLPPLSSRPARFLRTLWNFLNPPLDQLPYGMPPYVNKSLVKGLREVQHRLIDARLFILTRCCKHIIVFVIYLFMVNLYLAFDQVTSSVISTSVTHVLFMVFLETSGVMVHLFLSFINTQISIIFTFYCLNVEAQRAKQAYEQLLISDPRRLQLLEALSDAQFLVLFWVFLWTINLLLFVSSLINRRDPRVTETVRVLTRLYHDVIFNHIDVWTQVNRAYGNEAEDPPPDYSTLDFFV